MRPYLLGMLSHRSGDEPGALRYAERLEQERNAPSYPQLYPYLAVQLGPARIQPDSMLPKLTRHPKPHERWLRAELHRELGEEAEALRWYASFPDPSAYDIAYLPASLLRRAEIHELRGERQQAAEHYRRFLELWRDADPELQPRVAQARERLRELEGR